MGNVYVKDEQSPFCSTAATSSSRPRAVQDDARRSSQGRPVRAAAQRLGLELSEHVIMLGRSGTIGAPGVGGSVRASVILAVAIQGSSRFGDLGCLPDQTHIRSSRGDCTRIPLAAGRLERTRPFFVAAFEAMQSIGSST